MVQLKTHDNSVFFRLIGASLVSRHGENKGEKGAVGKWLHVHYMYSKFSEIKILMS